MVADCKKVTVGDKADKQVQADVLEKDARNDLALLKISSLKMASSETKSLIQKLDVKIVPLASDGLLRSNDVDLGEDILVAGYPYGEIFSNSIKVTKVINQPERPNPLLYYSLTCPNCYEDAQSIDGLPFQRVDQSGLRSPIPLALHAGPSVTADAEPK